MPKDGTRERKNKMMMLQEADIYRTKSHFQLLRELKTTDDSEGHLKRQDGLTAYDSASHG